MFARTLIPLHSLRGPAQALTRLGRRPLGEVLFSDPTTRRLTVQVARINQQLGERMEREEELDEVLEVMKDLRAHDCDMLTLGQYLQPSKHHHPVKRFVTPEEFDQLAEQARAMGFTQVASGPLVRSSYHADLQAAEIL